ncbi:hypothetical protein H072_9233 [Dactylellina haptotyla CBS 200.50]|uniref:Uncharacterized protein n=1 Tax=Dactylellina haptotyla (strain CBS 200.50) TaxID=1284197 RepID=S8A7P6_DACHA|nr:hypothetical protein H072_9233 [Dactylellina haptotyla CBS 200.50]
MNLEYTSHPSAYIWQAHQGHLNNLEAQFKPPAESIAVSAAAATDLHQRPQMQSSAFGHNRSSMGLAHIPVDFQIPYDTSKPSSHQLPPNPQPSFADMVAAPVGSAPGPGAAHHHIYPPFPITDAYLPRPPLGSAPVGMALYPNVPFFYQQNPQYTHVSASTQRDHFNPANASYQQYPGSSNSYIPHVQIPQPNFASTILPHQALPHMSLQASNVRQNLGPSPQDQSQWQPSVHHQAPQTPQIGSKVPHVWTPTAPAQQQNPERPPSPMSVDSDLEAASKGSTSSISLPEQIGPIGQSPKESGRVEEDAQPEQTTVESVSKPVTFCKADLRALPRREDCNKRKENESAVTQDCFPPDLATGRALKIGPTNLSRVLLVRNEAAPSANPKRYPDQNTDQDQSDDKPNDSPKNEAKADYSDQIIRVNEYLTNMITLGRPDGTSEERIAAPLRGLGLLPTFNDATDDKDKMQERLNIVTDWANRLLRTASEGYTNFEHHVSKLKNEVGRFQDRDALAVRSLADRGVRVDRPLIDLILSQISDLDKAQETNLNLMRHHKECTDVKGQLGDDPPISSTKEKEENDYSKLLVVKNHEIRMHILRGEGDEKRLGILQTELDDATVKLKAHQLGLKTWLNKANVLNKENFKMKEELEDLKKRYDLVSRKYTKLLGQARDLAIQNKTMKQAFNWANKKINMQKVGEESMDKIKLQYQAMMEGAKALTEERALLKLEAKSALELGGGERPERKGERTAKELVAADQEISEKQAALEGTRKMVEAQREILELERKQLEESRKRLGEERARMEEEKTVMQQVRKILNGEIEDLAGRR